MARGDQRERDRAKKQARLQKEAKGGAKVSRSNNIDDLFEDVIHASAHYAEDILRRNSALPQVQLRPHYSIVWEVQTAWNIEDIK